MDETAGGAMGIEWAKGVRSGGGGMRAGSLASGKARKRGFGGRQTKDRGAARRKRSEARVRGEQLVEWRGRVRPFCACRDNGLRMKQLVHSCRVPLRVFSRAGVPYDESIA